LSLFVLTIGILGVSTGAVLARLAIAHPFVKSAYRVSFAALVITPIAVAFYRDEFRRLVRRDVVFTLLAGFFLSLHFAAWISSLDHTTVASSVILVDTLPVWTALINMASGRGKPSRGMWFCIALSLAGVSIVGQGDLAVSGRALWGDFLALLGGAAAAAYIFCGGEVRKKISLVPYAALCYGSSAVIMWAVVLAMNLPTTGFSRETWAAFLGMAILAQVIGHSCYNWALGYFSTGFVSISLLGEPIGSAVLAYFLFGEYPTGFKLIGFALLTASIVMSALEEKA
jgi:drug/metabolite transporter (DMT)-like permease